MLIGQPHPTSPANSDSIAGFRIDENNVLFFEFPLTQEEIHHLSGAEILPPTSDPCSSKDCRRRCSKKKNNDQENNSDDDRDQDIDKPNLKLVAVNHLSEDTDYVQDDVVSEIESADLDDQRFIFTEDEENFAEYGECGCICLLNLYG